MNHKAKAIVLLIFCLTYSYAYGETVEETTKEDYAIDILKNPPFESMINLNNIVVAEEEENIIWIGHPMVSDNDAYTPSQGWLPTYQIGFREDGVVVWREVEE